VEARARAGLSDAHQDRLKGQTLQVPLTPWRSGRGLQLSLSCLRTETTRWSTVNQAATASR
jgi:hypothetical protein